MVNFRLPSALIFEKKPIRFAKKWVKPDFSPLAIFVSTFLYWPADKFHLFLKIIDLLTLYVNDFIVKP